MREQDKSALWLYGTILFLCALYSIYICWLPGFYPDYIHSWTQSDRLAIAYRYMERDASFFFPRTFNLSTPDGITAVDLPITEYIVSLLMRLLNTHNPLIFRFYCLVTGLVAAACLFKTARHLTRSPVKATFVVLAIFLSPVIFYYQFSFIPSVFAFNYFLIALWFAVKAGTKRDIKISILFITFAVLVRISFLPVYVAFMIYLFTYIKKNKPQILPVLKTAVIFSSLGVIAWQSYKTYLSQNYGTQFLNHLLPAASLGEFISIIFETTRRWFDEYCSLLFYAMGLLYFINRAKLNLPGPRLLLLPLSIAAAIMVFILISRQFIDHEYYFFESFAPAVVLFMILAVQSIDTTKRGQVFLLVASIAATIDISAYSLFKKNTPDHYNREHISYNNFKDSDQLLKQYNIPNHAKILVFNAYTTNLPLMQMNRKGITVRDGEPEQISLAMKLPYDYIIVQDEFFPTETIYYQPGISSLLKRVGGNGHISIFKKEHQNSSASVPLLLGLDSARCLKFNLLTDTSYWINKTGNNDHNKMFSPTLQLTYPQFKDKKKIIIRFSFDCKKEIPAKIVFSALWKGKTVWYYDYPVVLSPKNTTIYSLFHFPKTEFSNDTEFRVYLWNGHNEEISFQNIIAEVY